MHFGGQIHLFLETWILILGFSDSHGFFSEAQESFNAFMEEHGAAPRTLGQNTSGPETKSSKKGWISDSAVGENWIYRWKSPRN